KTGQAADFPFTAISGTIANVTNIDSCVAARPACTVHLEGMVLKTTPLRADLNFPLQATDGSFSLQCSMGSLDASQVAAQARALSMVEINSFHQSGMRFSLAGNDRHATGEMTMLYDNLDVTLLRQNDDNTRSPRLAVSFLANA